MPWLATSTLATGMERLCSYVLHEKVAIGTSALPGVSSVMDGPGPSIAVDKWTSCYSHVHLTRRRRRRRAVAAQCQVVVHPNGLPHLQNPWKLWEATLKTLGDLGKLCRPEPAPPERLIAAQDGMRIDLGDASLEVATPGHAPPHKLFRP